jgi:hypothetical protein
MDVASSRTNGTENLIEIAVTSITWQGKLDVRQIGLIVERGLRKKGSSTGVLEKACGTWLAVTNDFAIVTIHEQNDG